MDPVDRAFAAAPRAAFLPPERRADASLDAPVPLGHGSTCSQPRTVDDMLRLLDVRPGMKVLDIGAGSGWTTALLAELTGPAGQVLGLEIVRPIAALGAANVRRHGRSWAWVELAPPGVLGAPAQAPFDRILVSADAATVPDELVGQLSVDGAMVLPVEGTMTRVRRHPGEAPTVTRHGAYRFVPLQ